MNILNKLTIKHLKMNKKRTVVTIIGIILSTALMVGIGLLMSTVRENMIDMVKQENGTQHAIIYNLSQDDLSHIKNNNNVNKVLTTETLGYSKLDLDIDYAYQYLKVIASNRKFLSTIKLRNGRLPANDKEIIISNPEDLNIKLGDTITLNIGTRTLNGNPINDDILAIDDEKDIVLTNQTKKEYKVVGIIDYDCYQSSYDIGLFSYTYQENLTNTVDAYIYFNNVKKVRSTIDKWTNELNLGENQVNINNTLLELYGSSRYSNLMSTVINSLIIVLVVLSIGCIIVIYNSFAISVMERKKQFGLLSSVGTTKKQIRKTVFFEAFIVGSIGIILGTISAYIGIGCVLLIINKLLPGMFGNGCELKLVTYPIFIIIPIIFMIITIIVSAFLPARSASKITPIEAIRLNDDIKIKGKKVKTPRLIRKIFGMEGEIALKNMKRNKKKYRITVLSLFISIVLFISFSGYMNYIFSEVNNYTTLPSYDIMLNIYEDENQEHSTNIAKFRSEIVKNKDIRKYLNYRISNLVTTTPIIDKSYYTEKYYNLEKNNITGNDIQSVLLLEVDEKEYKEMLKAINETQTKPIIYNHYETVRYSRNTRKSYSIPKYTSKLNTSIKLCETIIKGDSSGSYDCRYQIDDYYVSDFSFFGNEIVKYSNMITIIVPTNYFGNIIDFNDGIDSGILFKVDTDTSLEEDIEKLTQQYKVSHTYNNVKESIRLMINLVLCVKLLVYGFITLVTLIGVTSVFNTINTSIHLRRKEFAMLRSVGLSSHGFNKILLFESLFFGLKSLIYALPVSMGIIYLLYQSFKNITDFDGILIPYNSIIISIIAVFLIIIISTLYATRKMRHENILEAIREENI